MTEPGTTPPELSIVGNQAGISRRRGRSNRRRDAADAQSARNRHARCANLRTCKVDGCTRVMESEKAYYRRYSVCEQHLKSSGLFVDGKVQRFCQQCAKFQPVGDFDGKKKSCRIQLAKHSARRRDKLRSERLARRQREREALLAAVEGVGTNVDGGNTANSNGCGAANVEMCREIITAVVSDVGVVRAPPGGADAIEISGHPAHAPTTTPLRLRQPPIATARRCSAIQELSSSCSSTEEDEEMDMDISDDDDEDFDDQDEEEEEMEKERTAVRHVASQAGKSTALRRRRPSSGEEREGSHGKTSRTDVAEECDGRGGSSKKSGGSDTLECLPGVTSALLMHNKGYGGVGAGAMSLEAVQILNPLTSSPAASSGGGTFNRSPLPAVPKE
ncbi:hypothetical protein VaNZ11_016666, partial [Volvox africanus]